MREYSVSSSRYLTKKFVMLFLPLLFLVVFAGCNTPIQTPPAVMPTPTQAAEVGETLSLAPTATPEPANLLLASGEAQVSLPFCDTTPFIPIAFTQDGLFIYLQTNTGVMVYDLVNLTQVDFIQSVKPVEKTAISLDGKILAMALDDHTIQLIDLPDGSLFRSLPGHADRVDALAFAPDSNRLYSGSYDTWVITWDISGEQLGEFQPGGGEVYALAISPVGQQLAAITFEGPLRLWNSQTFEVDKELGSASAFSNATAVYSQDGELLLTGLGGGPLSLWTLPDGELTWSGGNYAGALSPDGIQLAHTDVDETGQNLIQVRSTVGQEQLFSLPVDAMQWKLVYSPDSALLASADDMAIRVWDSGSGRLLRTLKTVCGE
jgi:WD40 repeat protein